MCDCSVIEGIRTGHRSRRSFLARSITAGTAAVAAGLASARSSLAQASGTVVDLTHSYDRGFPTFSGPAGITTRKVADYQRDGYTAFQLVIDEHTGTHVDAPLHFSEDGTSVDGLHPQSLVCPLCIVDISARAAEDANSSVTAADIELWVSRHGEIPRGACVVMYSGWASKVGHPSYRNDDDGKLAFPGFSQEAAALLAKADVAAIGVDTLSLDPGHSRDFGAHHAWLTEGRYGIENLNNLDKLPAKGATIFVGAPKHVGGSGGPARVLAVV
jgi:kynurenine formamidase